MLEQITPVILTLNEAPNIGRTLERLRWAKDIVLVDSGSTDDTVRIAREMPQVRVFEKTFETHARQWAFAVFETGIQSEWVLALDADYYVTDEALEEIRRLDLGSIDGYRTKFTYCVRGHRLRSALYPPVVTLFRRSKATFVQDGHTQRVKLDGVVVNGSANFLHDDRKSLSRWLASQDKYMLLETRAICSRAWSDLSWTDRIRTFPAIAPFAVFIQCYLLKGGFLDGKAGLQYALQRLLAEALLGIRLLERRMDSCR
jgi:glycosyltransferase involved in cell wall biosynthesis